MFDDLLREMRKLELGVQVSIKLEIDDNGYFDRCCPSNECGMHFKVMYEDWADIVRDEVVYCPLCRHEAPSTEWNTLDQDNYHENLGVSYVHREIGKALQNDARRFNSRQNRDSFITMDMSYRPGHIPIPIPAKATSIMTQEFQCMECGCRYTSIGATFFCPACGNNNIFETFMNSIETVKKAIDAIPTLRQEFIHLYDRKRC